MWLNHGLGCPSWTQLDPAGSNHPPQGPTESRLRWGHHRGNVGKEGQKMLRKSEESNVREILCEHQVQWRRGRSCSRAPGRFTCSPQRNPWRSRFILKDCSLWEAPTLKHRRNEGRNKYWEELLLTDHNPSSHPTGPFRVEEAKELEMEWCWAWWKGRTEGGGIFAFVFVSYHSIFNFNWQKKKNFPQVESVYP